MVRAQPDGSIVRLKDVARIELGAQAYSIRDRLDGQPAAGMAIYQLPGTNAIATAKAARKVMEEAKKRFPADLDYGVVLDTTRTVTEGINEIIKTLLQALLLVILVVFLFLQSWRATLIPALAVPVSLIGTFAVFPLLGFSINTLSLFGLVLAIGLVVDDAIVVVEAVERHIEEGMSPKEAALQTMEEVSGPVVAIALILSAVFIPTIFIPGITGRLYQQFAVTIAISVLISAFNALSLSPALCALLLKPRKEGRGTAGCLFQGVQPPLRQGLERLCRLVWHPDSQERLQPSLSGGDCDPCWSDRQGNPQGFLPEEDQGYMFVNVSLPDAASLQRTDEVCRKIEEIVKNTPGVEYYLTVVGISLLSIVQNTYSGFSFVTLETLERSKEA